KKGHQPRPAKASTFLGRKREFKLGCLLADLCFGALQKRSNMSDSAPVLDPVAKREQILLRPFFAAVGARLFGHAIHPNSRALSLASLQAAVRKSARLIETHLCALYCSESSTFTGCHTRSTSQLTRCLS